MFVRSSLIVGAALVAALSLRPTLTAAQAPPAEPPRDGAVAFANVDEGFGVRSADDDFRLRVSLLLALRGYVEAPDDQDVDLAGQLRLGRVLFIGHIGSPDFRYFVQFEGAGGVRLLDLELTYEVAPELVFRAGRFRTPYSREFIMPLTDMQLVARSFVSDYFRAGRDTGVSVEGRVGDLFEYRAGVYNEDLDPAPLVVGRVAFDPLGPMPYSEIVARTPGPPRLSIGAAGYWSKRQGTRAIVDPMGVVIEEPTPEVERAALGFDLAGRVGPLGFLAEAHLDRREVAGVVQRGAGAFAQLGVFVVPGLLELTARYDWLTPDRETSLVGVQRVELGGALYFVEGRIKLQPRYMYTYVDDPIAGAAPARQGHLVDAQLLAWF